MGAEFGNYEIGRLLGRGGMGAVYEALHRDTHRRVALKILNVDINETDSRDRFLREGRSAASVNHPNTVYVYRTEEIEGTPVICMELVADGTLEERVNTRGPLPVAETVEYALQMIDGLSAAYRVGLLHRDIKPSNCFVGADGVLKVGDFGLSKPVNAGEQSRLTQKGMFLGTPIFSSPEQLLGESLDVRSDIYAVGVTLYFALTGTLPFAAESMMQVVATVLNGAPDHVTKHRAALPPDVAAVVMKAIARQARDRFQNYEEFRNAVLALRAPVLVPATVRERLGAWFLDSLLSIPLSFAGFAALQFMRGRPLWEKTDDTDIGQTIVGVVIALVIVGLPEGIWGRSPGKWLTGLRVVGPHNGPPGLPRALLRSVILATCWPVADLASLASSNIGLYFAVALACRLLVVAPLSRRNGWQTVYDGLTGTSVVSVPTAQRISTHSTVTLQGSARASAPQPHELGDAIGPFVQLTTGSAGAGCVLAWDPALRRRLWVTFQPDFMDVSDQRREVVRSTRLRWVWSDSRSGTAWHAYGAAGGMSLRDRVNLPVSWAQLTAWIDQLCSELRSSNEDGSLPQIPGVETLWIGDDDELILADTSPVGTGASPTNRTEMTLVAELIVAANAGAKREQPLPLFATRALAVSETARDAESVQTAINKVRYRKTEVSRAKRGWMLAVPFLPILMFMGIGLAVGKARDANVDRYKAKSLASYMKRDTAQKKQKVLYFSGTAGLVERTANRAGIAHTIVAGRGSEPDSITQYQRLAAIYLHTKLPRYLRDSARALTVGSEERRKVSEIIDSVADATPAEVQHAQLLVDSIWNGTPPGPRVAAQKWQSIATAVFIWLLLAGVCSLLFALLLRQGVVPALFRVQVVTLAGGKASRLRVVARQAMVQILVCVGALPFVGAGFVVAESDYLAPRVLGILAVSLVAWTLCLWHTWKHPSRSIADRITGTYLVPS